MDIVIIDHSNRPVAAGLLIHHGKPPQKYPSASSLRDFNRLSVNMLLYWECIRLAIERGSEHFSISVAALSTAALTDSRKQWGADSHNSFSGITGCGKAPPLPALNPDNRKFALAISAWQKLPVWTANLLGPHIVQQPALTLGDTGHVRHLRRNQPDGRICPPGPPCARWGRPSSIAGPMTTVCSSIARAAIGLRRLSIIDLEGGQQPLFNEDRSDRRRSVTAKSIISANSATGCVTRATPSGPAAMPRSSCICMNNMAMTFRNTLKACSGFALWDTGRRRLLLGRDRLGIKPVYLSVAPPNGSPSVPNPRRSSPVPDVTAELDPEALEQFLMLGYLPQPHSLFRNIHKLPAGHIAIVENGQIHGTAVLVVFDVRNPPRPVPKQTGSSRSMPLWRPVSKPRWSAMSRSARFCPAASIRA